MTHGANIDDESQDEVLRWTQYLATLPGSEVRGTNVQRVLILIRIQSTEMSRFRNKGFPFYLKMKEICAGEPAGAEGRGSYTTGSRHDLEQTRTEVATSTSSVYEDAGEDIPAGLTDNAELYGPQSILGNAMQFGNELDLTGLLELGGHIMSPDPLTRMTATSDAMSTISQLNRASSPSLTHSPDFTSGSGSHTLFSDIMLPRSSSTHTTLISSAAKISKPSSRARTPAASHRAPSAVSSRPSKRSKTTGTPSAMADAAAMTTMTGTINRATDCMLSFQSLLAMPQSATSAQALPETPPQALPQHSPPPYIALATAHINHDVDLPSTIRSALVLEFLHNHTFCQMFANLDDPAVRHGVAVAWYRNHYRPLPSNSMPVSSSTPPFASSSSFVAPASAVDLDTLWGNLPLTDAATSSPGSFSDPPLLSVGSNSDGGYSAGMSGVGHAEMDPYANYSHES